MEQLCRIGLTAAKSSPGTMHVAFRLSLIILLDGVRQGRGREPRQKMVLLLMQVENSILHKEENGVDHGRAQLTAPSPCPDTQLKWQN